MISELRTLVAIARHGTFSKAGDRVGLTQAAVSGQMKRLEDMLGFPLFDRNGRLSTLNDAGFRTLRRAEALLARFDRLGEVGEGEEEVEPLRVGAIASVQSSILPQALQRFRLEFPNRHVRVVTGVSLNLLDQLDAGLLDLSVMIEPAFGLSGNLTWHPLSSQTFALLVPAHVEEDNWRAVMEVHPFIRYERSSIGGRQVERFLRSQRLQVVESLEIDEVPAMVAMVAAGLGVALVPLADAAMLLGSNVKVIALEDDTFFRNVGVAISAHERNPAATAFVASLTSLSDAVQAVRPDAGDRKTPASS